MSEWVMVRREAWESVRQRLTEGGWPIVFCACCGHEWRTKEVPVHSDNCPLSASPAFTLTEEDIDYVGESMDPELWEYTGKDDWNGARARLRKVVRSAILAFLHHHGISVETETPTKEGA